MILKTLAFSSIAFLLSAGVWSRDLTLVVKSGSGLKGVSLAQDGTATEIRPQELKAPMGSLWKLFVFSFLKEEGETPRNYRCEGRDPEEIFCCQKGQEINLETALVRSCGPYFKEQLRVLRDDRWREFWKKRSISESWMQKKFMDPKTVLPVTELLTVLEKMKSLNSFPEIQHTLFRVVHEGTLKGNLRDFGSRLLVKTWTWEEEKTQKLIGGFAGWTSSGETLWVRGLGSSQMVAMAHGKFILSQLPQSRIHGPRVTVRFFSRYPLKQVLRLPARTVVTGGILSGDFEVLFLNGKSLKFFADGKLSLKQGSLTGTFAVDEYVARVIDREGASSNEEAARAFSLMTRTYLFQNGEKASDGFLIRDTSDLQRVSVSPPTPRALKAAQWSHGMYLEGGRVNYGDKTWGQILRLAQENKKFEQILSVLYPTSRLAVYSDKRSSECQRDTLAERYLTSAQKSWRKKLLRYQGFEEPEGVSVCRLSLTKPYSDSEKNRIYLHFDGQEESRLTLTHEYLHLGFKHHPSTKDEVFIENLTQKISGVQYE